MANRLNALAVVALCSILIVEYYYSKYSYTLMDDLQYNAIHLHSILSCQQSLQPGGRLSVSQAHFKLLLNAAFYRSKFRVSDIFVCGLR